MANRTPGLPRPGGERPEVTLADGKRLVELMFG